MKTPLFNSIEKWADYHCIGIERFSTYHYRLENKLDVWPTTKKCRFIDSNGETKEYDSFQDLIDILKW